MERMDTLKERRILVLIVVVLLVSGAVLSVFVYNVIQSKRVASVSVRTDKMVYNAGEDVTFQLVDNTPCIDFNVTDPSSLGLNYANGHGQINIVKIPEAVSLDTAIRELLAENIIFPSIRSDSYLATIHYRYFDSKHAPLNLSWDGMILENSAFTKGPTPATSGYYAILPDFRYLPGVHIDFHLDRGAIFYYNSLNAGINITNNPDRNVSVKLTLGTVPGTVAVQSADLHTNFYFIENSQSFVPNGTIPNGNHYHNQSVILTPGIDMEVSFVLDVKVPDNGENAGGTWFSTIYFTGLLITPSGNYSFGLNGTWKEGWKELQQY